ncbi:MAG: ribonuclease HII [Gammaproteobacteria bacterium]|jgi:ribonuclease HII|nr:ribonuclease HII [Gammaproteobacteria bacterium]MBT7023471.1 ribonuclease HII [Gammaproteobacteria bacterium]MBT8007866.1 ribonuclease HII [Gammaproteobacteria bacterium]
MSVIAGVDEVGRGPLIGAVVAAAVVLPENHGIIGLADSKKLSAKRRERLAEEIRDVAVDWAITEASHLEIDEINILHASMLAMKRAVEQLSCPIDKVLVDGNRLPDLSLPAEAIIKGDSKIEAISAASIIAKVARDRMMLELHQQHPEYGFDRHKGYPTKLHFEMLKKYGVLEQHRRSFRPVQRQIALTTE